MWELTSDCDVQISRDHCGGWLVNWCRWSNWVCRIVWGRYWQRDDGWSEETQIWWLQQECNQRTVEEVARSHHPLPDLQSVQLLWTKCHSQGDEDLPRENLYQVGMVVFTKWLFQTQCSRFVPRQSETAYIYLMKGSGCSSSIGRTGSRQTVSLGTGCVYSGNDSCFEGICLN